MRAGAWRESLMTLTRATNSGKALWTTGDRTNSYVLGRPNGSVVLTEGRGPKVAGGTSYKVEILDTAGDVVDSLAGSPQRLLLKGIGSASDAERADLMRLLDNLAKAVDSSQLESEAQALDIIGDFE